MPIPEVNSVYLSLGCPFTYGVLYLIKKLQDMQKKKKKNKQTKKQQLTYQEKKQLIELDPGMARMLKLPDRNLNNGYEL